MMTYNSKSMGVNDESQLNFQESRSWLAHITYILIREFWRQDSKKKYNEPSLDNESKMNFLKQKKDTFSSMVSVGFTDNDFDTRIA